jgi:uncharacterized protein (TIGR03435 family)
MTPFLTNHLWQATCFALLAALLAFALRKHSPKVRYCVWLSASLKFLLPFALLMNLGSVVPRPAKYAQPAAMPAFTNTLVQIAQPFSFTPSTTTRAHAPRDWAPATMGILWAIGFIAIVITRLRGWLRVRSTLQSATPIELPIRVRALVSSAAQEPGVVGFLRPVLVIPAHLMDRLNPTQFSAILAHELSHVRRRDNLFAAVHMLVEAIFWFHPLVWWIGSRMLDERELACDEAVLCMGCEPSDYAEGILNVCRFYLESPLPCVSGVTGADVKKRLRAILAGTIAHELTAAKKVTLAAIGLGALAAPIVIGVLNAPAVRAQNATAPIPKFEVVSIKPCEIHQEPGGVYPPQGNSSPGNLRTNCFPLLDNVGFGLIREAYDVDSFTPVTGAPSWVQNAFYKIDAKAEGSPNADTMRGPMMQTLLAERFHLKIHRQTVEGPVYYLDVAHRGPKLQPWKEGSCVIRTTPLPPLQPGQQYCNRIMSGRQPNSVVAEAATLDEFSTMLRAFLDHHPVINKTGISGLFDLRVVFAREGTPDSDGAAYPSIYTAIQEQLGLKLESGKGPVETFVIDHIERPAEN